MSSHPTTSFLTSPKWKKKFSVEADIYIFKENSSEMKVQVVDEWIFPRQFESFSDFKRNFSHADAISAIDSINRSKQQTVLWVYTDSRLLSKPSEVTFHRPLRPLRVMTSRRETERIDSSIEANQLWMDNQEGATKKQTNWERKIVFISSANICRLLHFLSPPPLHFSNFSPWRQRRRDIHSILLLISLHAVPISTFGKQVKKKIK